MAGQAARPRDWTKWALFAALGALVAFSAWLDDRFVLNAADPEWKKFAGWPQLLPHAALGAVAIAVGPFQFSDRLRAARPALHRWMGRTYATAALVAGPLGAWIAWRHHSANLGFAQVAWGALWALTTTFALVNAMARNFPAHKLWMMRSYGFCLIFILARIPDVDPHFDWDGPPGVGVAWAAVVLALVLPDVIQNVRELWRRRRPRSAR